MDCHYCYQTQILPSVKIKKRKKKNPQSWQLPSPHLIAIISSPVIQTLIPNRPISVFNRVIWKPHLTEDTQDLFSFGQCCLGLLQRLRTRKIFAERVNSSDCQQRSELTARIPAINSSVGCGCALGGWHLPALSISCLQLGSRASWEWLSPVSKGLRKGRENTHLITFRPKEAEN